MKSNNAKMFICLLVFMSINTFAQEPAKYFKAQKAINDVFINITSKKNLRDSIFIFAANFKVNLVRSKGKCVITELTLSDSLAFEYVPNFEELKRIDFGLLLGNSVRASVIIPLLICNFSSQSHQNKDIFGKSPISGAQAVRAALELNATSTYYLKYPQESKLASKYKKVKNINFNPLIFLEPYVAEILDIP